MERILIVDDHPLVREGMKEMLQSEVTSSSWKSCPSSSSKHRKRQGVPCLFHHQEAPL